MSVLDSQVGGNHYKRLAIQPFVFVAANAWDAFAKDILKYITRYREKGGRADLEKALHIARMRNELHRTPWIVNLFRVWFTPEITMEEYISANAIHPDDRAALYLLDDWITFNSEGAMRLLEQQLTNMIEAM